MALLSALAAFLSIGLVCAFWIATAWPDGAIAALMAAIIGSFFATLDDPVPQMLAFLGDVLVGFVLAGLYLFVILPQIAGFPVLVLALAPFYLLVGAFIAVPATFMRALSIALNGTMMLTLTDSYSADFAGFINTSAAAALGILVAAGVTALVRSVDAEVTVRRLRRACRRDVARAATRRGIVERPALAALLLDRLAELAPRLTGADADADAGMQRALRDVTVGLSGVDVRHGSAALPPGARDSVDATLAAVGAHYARREPEPPAPDLLARIDGAIASVAAIGAASVQQLLMELLAIRQGLFPDARAPDLSASGATLRDAAGVKR